MKRPDRLAAPAAMAAILMSVACGGAGRNPVAPASTNQPPSVTKIEVVGYTIVGTGQSVPVRADVRDPDGEPVRCEWRPVAGRVLVDSTNSCGGMYFAPIGGTSDTLAVTPIDARGLAGSVGSLIVPLGMESVATGAPNPSASPDPTPTPRPEPSSTPTPEPSPNATPGPTPTPTPVPTPTPSPQPTPTPPASNHPPTVSLSGGGSCHPDPSCSRSFAATASDPDGDPITYTWTGAGCSGSGATGSVTINAVQTFTCTLTVQDNKGAAASASASASGTNSAPTITGSGGRDPIICGSTRCAWVPDRTGTLSAGVSDDDSGGGSCTVTAHGSCSGARCTASGSQAFIEMQTGSGGDCYVDIVWTDRWGARSSTVTDWYPVSGSPAVR